MRKILIVAAACTGLLVAAPVASAENTDPDKVAKKQCNADQNADAAAFEAVWGDHAMRDCKRAARDQAVETIQNASQECKAEQEADPAGFTATYGTGSGKNAHGKCVSSKVKTTVEEEAAEFENAAQECRAERTADPAGFATTYGSNANKKNAFGKCVSAKAKEQDEEPVEPAPTA